MKRGYWGPPLDGSWDCSVVQGTLGDRSRVSGGVICLSGSGLTVTVQPSAVSRLGWTRHTLSTPAQWSTASTLQLEVFNPRTETFWFLIIMVYVNKTVNSQCTQQQAIAASNITYRMMWIVLAQICKTSRPLLPFQWIDLTWWECKRWYIYLLRSAHIYLTPLSMMNKIIVCKNICTYILNTKAFFKWWSDDDDLFVCGKFSLVHKL